MIKLTDILNEFLYADEYTTDKYDNDSDVFVLKEYKVSIETETDSDIIIETYDYEDALYEFENWNISDLDSAKDREYEHSVLLSVYYSYYRFILEDEDVEDYPIQDYYDHDDIYELIDDGYYKQLKYRTVEGINEKANELLRYVESYFSYKYGEGNNYKYFRIPINTNDDVYIGDIQLRIADHTPNLINIRRHSSSILGLLSVVISDQDPTSGKFRSVDGYYGDYFVDNMEYSGDDLEDKDIVVLDIESRIDEIKKMFIEKFEDGEIDINENCKYSINLTDILREVRENLETRIIDSSYDDIVYDMIYDEFDSNGSSFIGLFLNNKIIGAILVEDLNDWEWMFDVIIDKKYRSLGYVKLLIDEFMKQFKKHKDVDQLRAYLSNKKFGDYLEREYGFSQEETDGGELVYFDRSWLK